MKCESCEGRWVALPLRGRHHAGRSTYEFDTASLNCPRCGSVGSVDEDVLQQHHRHPQVVATTFIP